jgi:hypothetical protein
MKTYMRRSDWVGNLQATLVTMVALVTVVKSQRSDSGERARIVTLCKHYFTYFS